MLTNGIGKHVLISKTLIRESEITGRVPGKRES
jgi:hypothetical protein